MTDKPIAADEFPVVAIKLDREGNVEYASPQIHSLMGIPPDQAVGKKFFDFFHIEESQTFEAILKNVHHDNSAYFEHTFQTPKGERYFCWQVYGGEKRKTVAFGFDMTHCKVKYDRIKAEADEAEAANRAKTDFIAHTSHELRTPLNAVIGYSEILLDEVYDAEPASMQRDLEKINSAAKHLLSLINSVLDLTKIEAGMMELYNEQFDIQELVMEIASTSETLVKRNQNQIQITLSKELGSMYGDRTKLREILYNLISNASKFTEKGNIHLSCDPSNGMVVFEVADTGIGMSQNELDALFKPYAQFKMSDRKGTGLGLLLCRRLTNLMGGDISVSSEANKGTKITVKLPLVYQERKMRRVSDSDIVLVIDDDLAVHDIVGRMLKKQGLKIVSAMNGLEGVRLAKECQPLAIILDLIMPEMDGWEVLHQIKSDPELKETPVVISTADNSTSKSKLAMKVDDYLLKPVNSKVLESILNRYRPEGEKKFTLMVVDDDPEVRAIVIRLAEKQGCEVHEASNGSEALAKLGCRPDLILLDLMMPVMNGFEFVQNFHRQEELRNIPLIVLTSKVLTKEDREYLGMYAQSLLEKDSSGYEVIEEIINEISLETKYAKNLSC